MSLRLLSRAALRTRLHPILPRSYTNVAALRVSNPFNAVALHSVSILLGAGLAYSFMEFYNPQRIETPTSALAHLAVSPDEAYLAQLRNELDNLPIVRMLRSDPALTETAAYSHLSKSAREHSLTASTLRGKGQIALAPLMFKTEDSTECAVVIHLGRNICGHDGIIHGGMLATILDEILSLVVLFILCFYIGLLYHVPDCVFMKSHTTILNIPYPSPITDR